MTAEKRAVDIDLSEASFVEADPLWKNLAADPRIGILVIDLRNRTRIRINGRVQFAAARHLHVDVDQAYPNCPQYIQRRNYHPSVGDGRNAKSSDGSALRSDQQEWIRRADTLFVSSGHPTAAWTLPIVAAIRDSFRSSTPGDCESLTTQVTACSTHSAIFSSIRVLDS